MVTWNKVKLGKIAFITSSKRIFAKEYQTEGIPFYRGKEIIEKHNGNDVSTELFITRERYEEIKAKFDVPKKGDILLSSVGTLGVSWLVDEEEFYFKDGNLTWLRNNERTTPEFLYLWLNSPEAQNQIDAMCIGSTQKALTIETLNKFDVTLPPLEIQKKICDMIYPISNKIRINTVINRNLSEQCFAIFHNMFNDQICESDMVEFGNVASFKYGTMPKKDKICDIGYPLFSGYKIVGYYPEKMFNEPQLIIVARGVGGTGDIKYTPANCYLTNLSIAIIPNKKVYEEYLYHYLTCQDMKILNTGSAQPQITISSLEKYKLYYPDEKVAKEFSDIVIPIRDRIRTNIKENQKLEELRESLLPRLMSGELDVSHIFI